MFETLSILPVSFWAVIAILIGGGGLAWRRRNDGTGLPMLAVLGTTSAWYVGDAFYNDYPNNHARLFDKGVLSAAWSQVAWFLVVFLVMSTPIHQWINRQYLGRRSGVMQMIEHGVHQPVLQRQLGIIFRWSFIIWGSLFVIALMLLKTQILCYLCPLFGDAYPWSHARLAAGFDFLSVVAFYLQLLSATMFGVVAALATSRRLRLLALLLSALAWPFFIFSRTRNTMLALVIPALLSWVFLRLRGGLWKKVLVLLACFIVINAWMKFVIANRSEQTIGDAFDQKGFNLAGQKHVHNEGLNMFEELCWVNTFIVKGTYHVNWGKRYFAELVNPIPRVLWPGKPLIGTDYAIARGQAGGAAGQAGINASVSTGFIGQGVVNFGRVLGPMAAALLMALWVAWLARFDLNVQALGKLPLYSLGLILTFNLGRDITLITLYPFVFGVAALWWFERHHREPEAMPATAGQTSVSGGPNRARQRPPTADLRSPQNLAPLGQPRRPSNLPKPFWR